MTLIIAAKCNEGILLFGDKQESVGDNRYPTTKMELYKEKGFGLAGSGNDADAIDSILTLIRESVDITTPEEAGKVIDNEIEIISKKWFNTPYETSKIQIVMITKDQKIYTFPKRHEIRDNFYASGAAGIFAQYILNDYYRSALDQGTVCDICAFVLDEASKTISSVGAVQQFGVDILFIHKNGTDMEFDTFSPTQTSAIMRPISQKISEWKSTFPLLQRITASSTPEANEIPEIGDKR